MLDSFARRLAASPLHRHLLFLSATCVTVLFVGYHVGTFDQAVHIPFLKKYADATLFPGDRFLDLRLQHYSYFWFFFLPVYKAGVLEEAMFAVHVLATYGTFWALWHLSDTLFQDPLANLLSLAAFVFPHLGFSGFPVIEFSLLNRSFVLPWLLLALTLHLRRQTVWAFLLLGAMYNLHALSVHFALAMILLHCAVERRRVGWRNVLGGGALFVIAALPVLLWRQDGGPLDLSLRPDWLAVISQSTFFHLFYFVAPYAHVGIVTLSGLSTLALFLWGRFATPAQAHDRAATIFVAALVAILAAQVVATYWLPITAIIQFQIARAGLFLLIFGYLYFARYAAAALRDEARRPAEGLALAGTYIFAAFPFMPLLVLGAQRAIRPARWRQGAGLGLAAALSAGAVLLALHYQLWHPGVYVYPRQTAWYKAQDWAKEHTPKDALFIVPPHEWWLYESDWRVFSERSPVVTHAELLEAAFAPEYLEVWLPRFQAVAPGSLSRFEGNIYENLRLTGEAYGRLTPADFLAIARRYGATYVVVERPQRCGFSAVYQNEQFVICALEATAAGGHRPPGPS